jgi:pimeloyl-ACP methyl ester carboxylesterase
MAKRKSVVVLAVLGAVAVFAAGCGSGGDDAQGNDQVSTSSQESTTSVPTTAGAEFVPESIKWDTCTKVRAAECATLQVPLDPDSASSPLIGIAMIRLPARVPSRRIGALIMNPGGPGASGIEFVPSIAPGFSAEIRDRFDLVSFDPRGVGASAPIECVDGPTRDALIAIDPSPGSPSALRRARQQVKSFVAACETNAGDRMPYLGTRYVARDLEYMRQALGEDRLDYLGYSYGSAIGLSYAEQFPTRIRSMTLDGIQDVSLTGSATLGQQYIGFEKSFQNWAADCSGDATCAFYNAGNATAAWEALQLEADRNPFPTSDRDGRVVGPAEFLIATIRALYSRDAWASLSAALAEAQTTGRGDGLLALTDSYTQRRPDGTFPNIFDANTAVNCADTIDESDNVWLALEIELAASAPHFAPGVRYAGEFGCGAWPVQAESMQPRPVAAGSPPILLVGSTFDPATPYEAAVAIDAALANSVLLTRDGEGHTSYVTAGNDCINRKVDDYLLNLSTPDPQTVCPS